ncbi:endonuclease/exonuclease/phosphatase family protein [Actinomadura hibisca]|uniref:endonuclease/exonuclease/phosphatase family protein n=1 Tax=Actinomadura hibisca TaxID=68565 RepID=UPI0008355833|nr:endonuclease/exonuclease/phosphatase family protein [Actinomadura hibisca]
MRILTWNLWWRRGPWRERRAAILETLRDLRPDIVGLQEVWGGDGENLAGWLAGELGMEWTWAPFDRPFDAAYGEYAEGVAVLSRWPIVDRDILPLPSPGSPDTGRVALYALVDAPPQPVPFFTAHLNYLPAESAVRCAQVRALSEFVAAHQGEAAFPAVVTGDLNAAPDSKEIQLLRGPAVPGQYLLDAWDAAEPGAPWATWNPANPYVGPGQPAMRIDYVHVGEPGPDGLGRVRSVRRVGDGPVKGVWPSDHAAVLAELDGPATT